MPGPNGRLIINARAETVTQKSLFRRSIAARRCVVPATAFYERDTARRAYTFSLPDSLLWLAGIYDNVDVEDRFVILTTALNALVSPIHDRMPLTLARSDIRSWLTDPAAALTLLAATPPLLERQAQDGQMGMEEFLNGR
nr:SOS response-associated peptidase family protein [Gemmiger formicilis]